MLKIDKSSIRRLNEHHHLISYYHKTYSTINAVKIDEGRIIVID